MANHQVEIKDMRGTIKELLQACRGDLSLACDGLLGAMGYHSKKRIKLEPNTAKGFLNTFQHESLNSESALCDEWITVDFLFQLTADEIDSGNSKVVKNQVNTREYESYLFFCIDLQNHYYTRAALSRITREINKLFPMPVFIIFRHGKFLSLSIVNRRLHMRDSAKDVLEKVTLVKDILIDNPHRAHIEILCELSIRELQTRFKFTNFPELHKAWQKTFSVDTVRKQFFTRFAIRFHELADEIELVPGFEGQGRRLSQLLLNRLLFLYFVQKKGWLNGEQFYLYSRLEECLKLDPSGFSYYRDVLQPLFLCLSDPTMSEKMADSVGVVPFLNGGLFEEEIRERRSSEENRRPQLEIANSSFQKIFDDLLERFIFTVSEDSAYDAEIAIDPEMLGKIFESLILQLDKVEDKDLRKMSGSYYTPRTIVRFMCIGALKEHISRQLLRINQNSKTIHALDALFDAPPADSLTSQQIARLRHIIPKSESFVLRKVLLACRVCDPSVGSGAFLVGMLQELMSTYRKLNVLFPDGQDEPNAIYNLKKKFVDCCLFGVDIQEEAVRLSELRLWLSLVVDYELPNRDVTAIRSVPSLPNLTYHVMTGDSLLEHVFGLTVDSKRLDSQKVDQEQTTLIENIRRLKLEYFTAVSAVDKQKLRLGILRAKAKLASFLIDKNLAHLDITQGSILASKPSAKPKSKKEQKTELARLEYVEQLRGLQRKVTQVCKNIDSSLVSGFSSSDKLTATEKQCLNKGPNFAWNIDFADVFSDAGGFDIVIGNPPYINMIQMDKTEGLRDKIRDRFHTARGAFDYFIPFYELSYNITNAGGVVSLITPNKVLSIDYAAELRKFLRRNSRILNLLDASHCKLFEAAVYPVSILFSRGRDAEGKPIGLYRANRIDSEIEIDRICDIDDSLISEMPEEIWAPLLEPGFEVVRDVVRSPARLTADVCKISEAAAVDEAYKVIAPLVLEQSDVNGRPSQRFVVTGTIDRYKLLWGKKRTACLGRRLENPVLLLDPNALSKERYHQFTTPKIIVAYQTRYPETYFDETGEIAAGIPVHFIYDSRIALDFLCGVLNSSLYREVYRILFSSLAMSGKYMRFGTPQLEKLPRPEPSASQESIIANCVRTLQAEWQQSQPDTSLIEKCEEQINNTVFDMFHVSKIAFEKAFGINNPANCADDGTDEEDFD